MLGLRNIGANNHLCILTDPLREEAAKHRRRPPPPPLRCPSRLPWKTFENQPAIASHVRHLFSADGPVGVVGPVPSVPTVHLRGDFL